MRQSGASAETASTGLKVSMQRLSAPTEKAKAAMKDLGFSFYDAAGAPKNFLQAIAELKPKLEGLTASKRNDISKTIFGSQGAPAILALIDAVGEKTDSLFSKLKNSDGVAETSSQQLKKGLSGAMTLLSSSLDVIQIKSGKALEPGLTSGLTVINQVIADLLKTSGAFDIIENASKAFADALSANPKIIKDLARGIDEVVTGLAVNAAGAAKQFTEYLKTNPEALSQLATQIKSVVTAIGEAAVLAANFGKGFAEGLGDLYNLTKPIVDVFNSISGASEGSNSLAESLGKVAAYALPVGFIASSLGALPGIIAGATAVVEGLTLGFAAVAAVGIAPILIAVAAVAAGVAAIVILAQNWDAITQTIANTWGFVTEGIKQAYEQSGLFKTVLDGVASVVLNLPVISDVLRLGDAIAKALHLKDILENTGVKNAAKDAGNIALNAVAPVLSFGRDVFNKVRGKGKKPDVKDQPQAGAPSDASSSAGLGWNATSNPVNPNKTVSSFKLPGSSGNDASEPTKQPLSKAEKRDETAAFNNRERKLVRDFDEQQRQEKASFASKQRQDDKAFSRSIEDEKRKNALAEKTDTKQFLAGLEAQKKTFAEQQKADLKQFEQGQAEAKKQLERSLQEDRKRYDQKRKEEDLAFAKQQAAAQKQIDSTAGKETKAVDRQLELEDAKPKDRKKLEKQFSKEDQKEARRDALMAPILAKQAAAELKLEQEKEARELAAAARLAAFEAEQDAKKAELEKAQQTAKAELVKAQQEAEAKFTADQTELKEQRELKLQELRVKFEQSIQDKQDAYQVAKEAKATSFEASLNKLKNDFEDQRNQAKLDFQKRLQDDAASFADGQRQKDIETAQQVAAIKAGSGDKPTVGGKGDAEGSKGESRYASKPQTSLRGLFTGGKMLKGESAIVNERGAELFRSDKGDIFGMGATEAILTAPMSGMVIDANSARSLLSNSPKMDSLRSTANSFKLGSSGSSSGVGADPSLPNAGGSAAAGDASGLGTAIVGMIQELKAEIRGLQKTMSQPRSVHISGVEKPVESAAKIFSDFSRMQVPNNNL